MKKKLEILDRQEELLWFEHFTNDDGWKLGCYMVERAKERGIAIAISIRLNNGFILFQYGPCGTSILNQRWMERKYNTVKLMDRSSLKSLYAMGEKGQTLADHGLKIPVVYNTGGYEKEETLRCLEGLVDIWLPDYKYRNPELAARYSHAEDYPEHAGKALAEMVRQAGSPVYDSRGMMQRGVIVRHLVLPGCIYDSKDVLEYLHDTWGEQIWVSILSQYTPLAHVRDFPELNRKITEEEYTEVVDYAKFLGMNQVYIQVGDCAAESFIPAFDYEGIDKI